MNSTTRSHSSRVRHEVRAEVTASLWPKPEPTSSRSTSAPTSTRFHIRWHPRKISPRPQRLVAEKGRRISTFAADVRQLADLEAAVSDGIGQLGEIDIVVANAGVVALGVTDPRNEQVYRDIVETNLFGAWNIIAATVPSIIRKGVGGSIVLTSSVQGLTGRGGDGSAGRLRIRRVETRPGRADEVGSKRVRGKQHPGEHRASHRGRHADDLE